LGKLIIDGKNVYEVDEECLKRKKVPEGCRIEEALKKQIEREKKSALRRKK
jgi:hypothetical protein